MSIEPERGGEAVTIDAEIEPGQQVALLTSKSTLLPGRYLLRAEMRSRTGASILQGERRCHSASRNGAGRHVGPCIASWPRNGAHV